MLDSIYMVQRKIKLGYLLIKCDYNDSARNEELYRGDIIVAVEGL